VRADDLGCSPGSLGVTGFEHCCTVAGEECKTEHGRRGTEMCRCVTNRTPHGSTLRLLVTCAGGGPGNQHAARRETSRVGHRLMSGREQGGESPRMVRAVCGADAAGGVAGACRNRTYQGSIEP